LRITGVKIREPDPKSRCLALADVTLDGLICVRDCKYTLEAVYFPSRRDLEGRWYPLVEIHNSELLFGIKDAVRKAYEIWLADSIVTMKMQ